jgi:hypothetical protein
MLFTVVSAILTSLPLDWSDVSGLEVVREKEEK